MIVLFCSGYETGCSILHYREFGEKMVKNPVEQTISIVETIKMISYSANTVSMEIYRHTYCTWLFVLRASFKNMPMLLATVEVGNMIFSSSKCGLEM